jgi:hypothetical protein
MVEVEKEQLDLKPNEGLVYYKNEPFTGFSMRYYTETKVA